jgi:hypothetical protein
MPRLCRSSALRCAHASRPASPTRLFLLFFVRASSIAQFAHLEGGGEGVRPVLLRDSRSSDYRHPRERSIALHARSQAVWMVPDAPLFDQEHSLSRSRRFWCGTSALPGPLTLWYDIFYGQHEPCRALGHGGPQVSSQANRFALWANQPSGWIRPCWIKRRHGKEQL